MKSSIQRIILICFAVMTVITVATLPFTASAQQKQMRISDQMKDSYYRNCLIHTDERMSASTHKVFCECTAHFMQENLTIDDLAKTRHTDPAVIRQGKNAMVIGIYAPCMEFPVRDLIYKRCVSNKFQVDAGICDCVADEMAHYTAQEAQNEIAKILQENPNIYDPMSPIVNSPSFEQKEKQVALDCIQNNQ